MKISEGRSSAQRSGQRQGSARKKAGILNPSSPGGKPSGRKVIDTGSNALPPARGLEETPAPDRGSRAAAVLRGASWQTLRRQQAKWALLGLPPATVPVITFAYTLTRCRTHIKYTQRAESFYLGFSSERTLFLSFCNFIFWKAKIIPLQNWFLICWCLPDSKHFPGRNSALFGTRHRTVSPKSQPICLLQSRGDHPESRHHSVPEMIPRRLRRQEERTQGAAGLGGRGGLPGGGRMPRPCRRPSRPAAAGPGRPRPPAGAASGCPQPARPAGTGPQGGRKELRRPRPSRGPGTGACTR